jgi:UDP-2,3-diacylglucosamine pyrophosphatase LpxH
VKLKRRVLAPCSGWHGMAAFSGLSWTSLGDSSKNLLVTMIPISSFEQVFIISDLHMGGPLGHQIFGQETLLSMFIDHLRDRLEGDCALIINGDMVDFLAQPNATCFEPVGAIEQLNTICDQFPKVWKSLREYVATPRRHLAITLGNHDLELALPWMREHLYRILTNGNAAARERITLSFDGSGYTCAVGHRQVLCVHGNEVDNWNYTDYEKLRRTGVDLAQGRVVEPWTPNAGAKLVVDVINQVKRQHAFIDLLKPEREGACRILLAMRPELKAKLTDVASIVHRWLWTAGRRAMHLLSVDEMTTATPDEALNRILTSENDRIDANRLMDDVERDFKSGIDPVDLVHGTTSAQLGIRSMVTRTIFGGKPYQVAWEAVKELAGDRSFDIHLADSDYKSIDSLAGSKFEVVVAGHTHLARSLPRRRVGSGWYFNCGTWAWLMHLKPEQLKTEEDFKPVFEQMQSAKTIPELGDLVWARPTVVVVQNGQEPTLRQVTLENNSIGFADPQ